MSIPSDTSSHVPADRARILIVEDDYIIAANLQEDLESRGYDIPDTATSVGEAIKKAAQLRPDLVLMDIRLQGELDGIQGAEFLWNYLRIPVIYVTGHSDKATLERAKETLPFGYLLKPVKGAELDAVISAALDCLKKKDFQAK